jgi:hypothetical protein
MFFVSIADKGLKLGGAGERGPMGLRVDWARAWRNRNLAVHN